MDGQDFVDQVQRPGYMIVFNLMLRPVLMIFGTILGYVTFGAMLWFVNVTFAPAAQSLGQTSSVGIVGVIVLIVIMSYIDFQIAIRSFHLITETPDRVARWFGHAGDKTTDDEHGNKMTGVLIGSMESRMSQTVTGLAGSKGPPPRPGATRNASAEDGAVRAATPAAGSPGSSADNPTKGI